MRYGIKKKLLFIVLAAAVCLGGCKTDYLYGDNLYYSGETWNESQGVLNGIAFSEDKSVYDTDADSELTCLYLMIQEGKNQDTGRTYSFGYLKNYTDSDLTYGEEPYCDVIMSEGTESASSYLGGFGFGEMTANGRMTVKGNTNRIRPRSYQIKLYDRAGLWEGVRTVNLIKNIGDLSRMKQKLCFDLVERLSGIGGMRTRFIHLYVYDTTDGGILQWVDMGLYLYVEQPNKAYLSAHGLDQKGILYRAQQFTFDMQEALLPKSDANYDKEAFEEILNIREGENHDKLLSMLAAVNGADADINELIGVYFNEENLLTYMAVSILTGNVCAFETDYLLYSPENSKTWYFICEGFRDSFDENGMRGYGFLMNNRLFRMYLQEPGNREKLDSKIRELGKILSDGFIGSQVEVYKKTILRYIYSMPEITLLPAAAENVEPYIKNLQHTLHVNAEYGTGPSVPYIGQYIQDGYRYILSFAWEEGVTYSVQLSADITFQTLFYNGALANKSFSYATDSRFYLRLKAGYPDGSWVYSGNIDRDYMGKTVYNGIAVNEQTGDE